jgi:hypothetical protein
LAIGSGRWSATTLEFDIKMLDKHILPFIQIGLPEAHRGLGLYTSANVETPPGTAIDLRFTSILDDLGLPNLGQHNALNDALMTAEMYTILRDMRSRGVRISRERGRADIAMGAYAGLRCAQRFSRSVRNSAMRSISQVITAVGWVPASGDGCRTSWRRTAQAGKA